MNIQVPQILVAYIRKLLGLSYFIIFELTKKSTIWDFGLPNLVKYGKLLTHSDTKIENVSIANDIEVRAHTYVIATGQTLDTDQMVKL